MRLLLACGGRKHFSSLATRHCKSLLQDLLNPKNGVCGGGLFLSFSSCKRNKKLFLHIQNEPLPWSTFFPPVSKEYIFKCSTPSLLVRSPKAYQELHLGRWVYHIAWLLAEANGVSKKQAWLLSPCIFMALAYTRCCIFSQLLLGSKDFFWPM